MSPERGTIRPAGQIISKTPRHFVGLSRGRSRVSPIVCWSILCHARFMAKSVLVVDDDQAFRDVVSDLLRSRGFEVSGLAATSDEAVHAVRLLRPDGVLLDVTLASMDDFE